MGARRGSALLAAVFCVLAIGFLQGERARGRLLAQYEAERIASGLFVIVAQAASGDIPGEELAGALRRAATYDAQGRVEGIRIGDAPLRLEGVDLQPGEDRYLYDRGDRSLTIIRRRWLPEPLRRAPRVLRNEFVLVEVDASRHFRRDGVLFALQLLLPLAASALAYAAVRLMQSNARYRQQLAGQQQLVQLGEAARTLAHEIKNPLGAIRLSTGLLRKQTARAAGSAGGAEGERPIEAGIETGLDNIDGEVSRLATLADRMGDFIRDPVGTPVPVDVNEMLVPIPERHRGVELASRQRERLPVSVDLERMRSVLDNLVANAVEAGGSATVEVAAARDGESVRITVADRGSGIEAADQDRLFDPFYTSKSKGSGLGLAIARRFAVGAGGSLSLSPRSGGGTVATLRLPLAVREGG